MPAALCDLSEDAVKDYLLNHVQDCTSSLSRDDLMSLAMGLQLALVHESAMTNTDDVLLPNSVLEPGYPRRISVQTARMVT